jgi:syntaxin 5
VPAVPPAQLGAASDSGAGGGAGGSSPLLAPPGASGGAAGPQTQSECARRAARIGHGIHSTSAKLTRLTQLARRTSVFDDPTAEINELTAIIKQDITALNSALGELQAQASQRSGSRDSGEHSVTVVDALLNKGVKKPSDDVSLEVLMDDGIDDVYIVIR